MCPTSHAILRLDAERMVATATFGGCLGGIAGLEVEAGRLVVTLTDPAVASLSQLRPDAVPSGLPVP